MAIVDGGPRALPPVCTFSCPCQPAIFITSQESKAKETGRLLAGALRVPTRSSLDLHEHDRQNAPFFSDQQEFKNAIGRLFARPNELIFGRETGAQASQRINDAISQLLTEYHDRSLAIVTHGTVLTLFINRYNPTIDPLIFWNSLKMPCAALLRLPDLTLQALILPVITEYNTASA